MEKLTNEINITPPITPIKDIITRKITFKNHILRELSTMASHYHFDKPVKQDELLSMMIEDIVSYYYDNKFIMELKKINQV
ncbi:MAG: hypothetical protein K2P99_07395 [Burkholderiales bacterium]|nr:hypothetical protein [Burkholderiales bacterium]